MKRTYNFRCMLIVIAAIVLHAVPWAFDTVVHSQTRTTLGVGRLHEAFAQASGRFIENVGQFPHDIRFVAPYEGGWILFFDDRVESWKRKSQWSDREYLDDSASTIPFLSRKESLKAGDPMLAKRDNVMDTVLQFDDLTISEGHGRRAERVHYFSNHGPCRGVTTAPTWDTLLYLGSTRRLTFHFVSGHVVIEQYNFTEIEHNHCEQRYPFGISRMDLRILRSSGDHSGSSVDILYSTYLGGSRTDAVSIIRQVGEHRFILVGTTDSQDFPIVGNPFSSTLKGDPASMYSRDVHITCLDVQRNEIMFSSYFGGWDLESLVAVEIDASGNIVFAGSTWSDDLPTTENAWQRQYAGHGDGYIAALNDTGSELVFCSYIGGAGVENLKAMKMDEHGDIVISGLTDSWSYPTTAGVVQSRYGGGEDDIFVTKFNHDASELVFSTFIGGAGWDEGRSLDFTPDGNILVAGYTNSSDFPVTQDALYRSRVASDEGCVFILTPGGRRLVYSSYISWNKHEEASSASLDADGVMTVFGITTSSNLPVNESSYQRQKGEAPEFNPTSEDFYVLKYRMADGEILACTYLGGSGRERYSGRLIAMSDGSIVISGSGNSRDYPLTVPMSGTSSDVFTAAVTCLKSDLTDLVKSITIGGSDDTFVGSSILMGTALMIAGITYAPDFSITADAYQSTLNGDNDGFFTIIDLSSVISSIPFPLAPVTPAIEAYPQPAGTTLHLAQRLDPAAVAIVTLHDCRGRLLRRTSTEAGSDGMLRVMLNVSALRPGVYDCRISSGGRSSRRLVSIVR